MVNLTPQDTIRLIAKMRALYGRKFDQQWQGVDPQMLAETFADGLHGLTGQELACGVNALMRHDWPPTVPEFRRMCQPIDPLELAWDTPEVAWAKAIQNADEMTTFATCDQIQQAWGVAFAVWPDKYAARKAFCDSYERLVAVARLHGLLPVWWVSLGQEAPVARAIAIEQAVESGQVGIGYKSDAVAMLEQNKPLSANVAEHIAAMKAALGVSVDSLGDRSRRQQAEIEAKKQAQIDALQSRSKEHESWPDPFDNAAEYVASCRKSGRPIPAWYFGCVETAK